MSESRLNRRWLPACVLSVVFVASCGGDSDSGSPGSVSANQITTVLTADQQVPPLPLNASRATSVLTIDTDTGEISGNITLGGLSSAARMAHIHNAASGINGPVRISLNIDETGASFNVPNGAALDAVGIDNYLNGELYLNVHTDDYPAGEVRGQLIPADAEGRTRFSVQVSNVSTDATLSTPSTGGTVSVPLSPGAYLVHSATTNPFIQAGSASSEELEVLAEDGNAAFLRVATPGSGVFDTPDGATIPRPIDSGESYTFTITAVPGDKLSLLTMFVQSNDWFYTTYSDDSGIALFDNEGTPVTGDVTDRLSLWESDTEEDQEPGTGTGQAPRQTEDDMGTQTVSGTTASLADKGKLDGLNNVLNGDVIRVTITPIP